MFPREYGLVTSPSRDVVSPNGQRFVAKVNGSMFDYGTTGQTLSCLFCGKHKPRSEGRIMPRFSSNFVCFGCKPATSGVEVQ